MYVMSHKKNNNLKINRQKLGFTLEKVAINCGLTRSAYTKIENGSSIPKLSTALILAEFFRSNINDLFPILKHEAEQKVKK